MPTLLRMPAVAANESDTLLSSWLVESGGSFTAGQAIAVVETEKAAADVEADADGVLVRTLVAAGTNVEVGDPIALLAAVGETVSDIEAALVELGVTSGAAPEASAPTPPTPPAPTTAPLAVAAAVAHEVVPAAHSARVFASPIARRLAKAAGLSVESLNGTGPGGRIVRRDVEAAIAAPPTASVASAVATTTAAASFVDIPHTRMRRIIATRLQSSKQTIPHFYLHSSCRVDALLAARAELNEHSGVKVSINDFVIKAMAWAHQQVPEMNVVWGDDAIRQFASVDMSVAIAIDGGLVTPVLRSVETLGLTQIAAAVQAFAARAKSGHLLPDEMSGGSITITNLGMFGVEEFAAIINPPQAAILAVGAVTREPVVNGEAVEIESVMRFVLSVDHRPVDGVIAAAWMQAFGKAIEHPILLAS